MNQHAFAHEPKTQYGYGNPDGRITLRFRTAKDDAKRVIVIYGDKYIWQEQVEEEMIFLCSDEWFDYYETSVLPVYRRLAYYFRVEGKGREKWYFTEWGPTEKVDESEVDLMYFNFPYVNQGDIHQVPKWVKNAVFYQIFPERFGNGDPENDPEGVVPWSSSPTRENFFGGDLKGIMKGVNYLAELGINAIYMTPVFESPSNHKYNTTDYFKIDPAFGTLEDLKKLVKKCHQKGIKVVFDAVFNHSGIAFQPFQDVLKNGEESSYKDWFHLRGFPVTTEPLNYETFGFEAYMPKLNTENPEVIDYLCKVGRYWIEEADIDGWRLDVANEVDHGFWRRFRAEVKRVKPEAYIVGEIWHNARPWLMGDQFDGAMNYPFTRACLNYFAYGKLSTEGFQKIINHTYLRNTKEANSAMLNILDSHDTPRFLTRAGENIKRLKLAALFQMSFVGAPSVYYGTEIGMTGAGDPDCRRAMVWDKRRWNEDLLSFYKEVIALRKSRPSLRAEKISWLQGENQHLLGYIKESGSEKTLILMNNSRKKVNCKFNQLALKEDDYLLGNGSYKVYRKTLSVELEALEYLIFNLR